MSGDTCIFFYHGGNYSDIPARQQYLMRAMSRYLPVVFLDGVAEHSYRVEIEAPQGNVTVVRGLVPFCQRLDRRGLTFLARKYANWRLRRFRRQYRRIIFWASENWLRPYRFIDHDALIFDCIDPCFSEEPDRVRRFQERDRAVLAEADLAFATADTLAEFCRRNHANVVLLNNAADSDDYRPELLEAAPRPAWWPENNKPVAAYLGNLDWRVDFAAVTRACREHPEIQFVMAGNPLHDLDEALTKLKEIPNVICPGRISLADGRYLLRHCAIGMIPFTTGRMNDAINPVKMYIYALLGKPIAGTKVHELTERPHIVFTAHDFSRAVEAALDAARRPDTAAHLQTFAAANTWGARAETAWAEIQKMEAGDSHEARGRERIVA